MTRITVRARLNPTESPEKVRRAITNIFGGIPLELRGDEYVAEMEGLDSLRNLREHFARERIRDSARPMLMCRAEDNELSFNLNRQAAYMSHLSIYHADKVPMGPIEVKVKGSPEAAIEYLCGKRQEE
jgi:predicted RNA binding protein with dsRBD fold (UPF0201 family)